MPARAWAEADEQADAEAASALCACSGPPVGERFVFQEADMVRSGSQGQSPLPTPPRVDGGGAPARAAAPRATGAGGAAAAASRPPARPTVRLYQVWEGNEVFCCRGHLVTGPSWRGLIMSTMLTLVPAVLWLVLVLPELSKHTSWALFGIGLALVLASQAWLYVTAFTEPGILPRKTEPDAEDYQNGIIPRTKTVQVNGKPVTLRWNDTVNFYQPPRAHHCSVQNNCVEKFDHHCPWVGVTIGLRNYRFFLLFVYTTTALLLYVMGTSIAQIVLAVDRRCPDGEAAQPDCDDSLGTVLKNVHNAMALAVTIYAFLMSFFVGGLCGFHSYLVATNQTTYENFRYRYDADTNPYNVGCMGNCFEAWCKPIPKSKVKFRTKVGGAQTRAGSMASYDDGDIDGMEAGTNGGAGGGQWETDGMGSDGAGGVIQESNGGRKNNSLVPPAAAEIELAGGPQNGAQLADSSEYANGDQGAPGLREGEPLGDGGPAQGAVERVESTQQ